VAAELALPIAIGVDLINENGPMLAAVPEQVSLPIAIDIEPADHTRALDWFFPNGGVDSLPLAVWTVFPCQAISCGRPTFIESRRAVTFFSFVGDRRRSA
jgi:hypothetical protein